MKKIILSLAFIALFGGVVSSQEKFGRTLNIGAGVGYYGYGPAMNVNYEFDLFRNFTLAPFISVLTYRDYYYWGNPYYPYRNYYYRETVIPVGVKGSYYFDELFEATDRWDFYASASLGVAFRRTVWENDYYGDRVVVRNRYASPLYGDLHIGTECHLSQRVGLFLDLSTGLSTLGLGFHL